MNILITGGLGYVGGRLADHLKTKTPNSRIFLTTRDKNKELPLWAGEFTVLEMDLLDESSVSTALESTHIDLVIHLAALNEIDSMENPEKAQEVNVNGTNRLLNASCQSGVSKFIYFSTFHVYGNTSSRQITELTPTRTSHPYAATHLAAESIVDRFKQHKDIKTLILRLSNGYGYPMDKDINRWTLVFNDFCRQAVTTGKIVLKTSGRQYRDFVSLCNVARAVNHFISVAPDAWGDGLYNLGGECNMSILEAAEFVSDTYKSRYDKEIQVINGEESSEDIFTPVDYSIEKLKNTGFCLEGNMASEVEKTFEACNGLNSTGDFIPHNTHP